MQKYAKQYLEAFGLDETDFIACGICEGKAVEFHHILNRAKHKDLLLDVRNLLPVCRTCHDAYGERKEYTAMLLKINRRHLQIAGIDFNEKWFNFYIKKYE